MKAVFVGGGAHRLLSILRGALAQGDLFSGGEIHLHDLDVARAETLGRLLMKTPEYRALDCKVTWGASLDKALDGADVVGVILMAGSPLSHELGNRASWRHGFVPSDNVSPNGALLGVKGAPILLDLARRMERLCPDAWLLDFANPIAVHSGMVNRHTKIKALGLCGGYMNHLSDIGRIFGKDAPRKDLDVDAVGVNHLSFIVRATLGGKDLFPQLDRRVRASWKMPVLNFWWSEGAQRMITASVTQLVDFYRKLGVLIFSTEGDGMLHLDYEGYLARDLEQNQANLPTRARIESTIKKNRALRAKANSDFAAHANRDLDDAFWSSQPPNSLFARLQDDIFIRAMRGISGQEKVKIVTSRINGNAVANLPADVVCEYSQWLHGQTITPVATHRVPDIVQGLISSLATHQTMLGDACATGDPKLLAQALLAYPVRLYSNAARDLYRELIEVNREEIPKSLRKADQYL